MFSVSLMEHPIARVAITKDAKDFFLPLVDTYLRQAGLDGGERTNYIAAVLSYFLTTDNLFDPYRRIGKKPQHVVYMGDLIGKTRDAEGHEKFSLALHTAEYALFMTSLMKEFLRKRGIEDLWINAGRSTYDDLWAMSRSNPRLYKSMASDFRGIVEALREMQDNEFYTEITNSDLQYLLRPKELSDTEMKDRALDALNKWKSTGDAEALREFEHFGKRFGWKTS